MADPDLKERLRREARTLAALNHPNIVTVFSVEETRGVHFLTMELLEGKTLAEILAGAGLPRESFLDLASQLLGAVRAAHERGVVHRDLKPANIIVGADGRLKVLDFGLAKVLPGEGGSPALPLEERGFAAGLTEPGMVLGTVSYLSPEQARAKPVDQRSDIFSLGVMLHEMATGQRPFSGRSPLEVISSILRDPPAPFAEGTPAWVVSLRPVIDRCLEKEPERRYQRVSELLDDLLAFRDRPTDSPGAVGSAEDSARMGREALKDHAWSEAFAYFSRADSEGGLSSEDLLRLAEAAFWTGKLDDSFRFLERAYAGHVREGHPRRAALVAVKLADLSRNRRANSASMGWLKRAERLLEGAEDTVEYGYLLQFKTPLEKDPEAALRLAQQTFDIARRSGDANLEALSLQDQGRALVLQGKVSEGMALLDEAIVTALSGDVDQFTVASTYCSMISACERVADYRRAGEWSQEARSWSEPHAGSPFPGLCTVYQARFMSLRGALKEAEEEVLRVCGDSRYDFIAAEAFYELGMIRLRRGDHAGAEEAFREAHQRGRNPNPGLPLLLLTTGKPEPASELIDRALGDTVFALDRAKLLPARIRIALACGDLARAEESVVELESIASHFGQAGLSAAASQARGSFELAKGQFEKACASLRSALAVWVEMDLPHEAAMTRLRLAEAYRGLEDKARAELELRTARSVFERLGAADDIAAVDVLIGSN
jgi:tetratricopeptide (TPR) repeat protein